MMFNRRILFVVAAVAALAGYATRSNPVSVADTDGASVALSKAGGFVIIEEAMVQTADISAPNGVVHVMDSVLIPPVKHDQCQAQSLASRVFQANAPS